MSRGTASLNPNSYYALLPTAYTDIDEDCYVSYGGLTSNTVNLKSNITWEWLGYGFDAASDPVQSATAHFYEFFGSTLSTETIMRAPVTDFTYQYLIDPQSGAPSDATVSITKDGNKLTISHSSAESSYDFDVLVSITCPKGTFDFYFECVNEHANHYTVIYGTSYSANAHE